MKVLCIAGVKSALNKAGFSVPAIVFLIEGNIYTVVRQIEWWGHIFYILEERNDSEAFLAEMFVPISDIDETELIKERELVNH